MNAKRHAASFLFLFLCSAILSGQQGSTASVTILLKDQTGAAIPHAIVRVIPAPEPGPKMETDESGKLAIKLKPGGYAVFSLVSGFRPLAAHFDVSESQENQSFPFVLQIASSGGPVAVVAATAKPDLTLLASPYHEPTGETLAQLKALPHTTVTFHNSHTNADETYSGVRVADLFTPLGAPLGKELHGIALTTFLVATGSDGYQVVLALAEVDPSFHPGEVIVADAMNGKPLDEHNGPLKLVVTEDKRPARSVRNLVSIELESAR